MKAASLEGLDPEFRATVGAVLGELQEMGYTPLVYSARRTIEEQREYVERGVSWTMASKHVDGLAVDVIDGSHHPSRPGMICGWGSWEGKPGDSEANLRAMRFFAALGIIAKHHGLTWGGDWAPPKTDKPHVEAG